MRKKLQRILIFALVFVFALSSVPALAVTEQEKEEFQYYADILNSLGLFKGTDAGYELERVPNRTEAAVMLIRLLGKETEALASTASHPFTDVPEWADRYVAYMYDNELTKGVSDTSFGADQFCAAKMYVTFVLRALGYSDANGDFTYDNSLTYARIISLIGSDYLLRLDGGEFVRGDLALISFNALFTGMSGSDTLLLEKLVDENAVASDKAGFYLNVLYANEYLDLGYYMNYKNGSISYKETEAVSLSAAGYTSQDFKIVSEYKGADLYTDSTEHMAYTVQYPGGQYAYNVYYTDGYLYYSYDDGEKYKVKLDSTGSDTSTGTTDADSGYMTIFDYYQSVAITESNGSVRIDAVLSKAYGTELATDFLTWFDYFDPATDIVIVSSAKEQSVVNSDGYLEKTTVIIEFEYMLLEDGIRYTVIYEDTTEYTSLGNVVTVTLPNDLSSYPEQTT